MPLQIEIRRDGNLIKPAGGWTGHVLNACFTVVMREHDPELVFNKEYKVGELPTMEVPGFENVERSGDWSMLPLYAMDKHPLIGEGRYKLQRNHVCLISDEETEGHPLVLSLQKGDEIIARRVMKS